jgi:hypothetical protein
MDMGKEEENYEKKTDGIFVMSLDLTGIQRRLCAALYNVTHLAVS